MKGLVWAGGTSAEVREVPAPPRPDGWVRVDVAAAGLCGTDLHVLAGEHVRAEPGVVLGHEFAGRLAEPCGDLAAGDPVFVDPQVRCGDCDACRRGLRTVCARLTAVGIDYPGATAAYTFVPRENVYPLPDTLDLTHAALVEPVAVAIRAVRRSGLTSGTVAHVVGGGPIGCLVALVAMRAGAEVTLSEPAAPRAEFCERLGVPLADPADTRPVHDIVLDATGTPAVSASVCDRVRPAGTLVVVGAYPPQPVPFDLLRVMFAELTVVGTRIYDHDDIRDAITLLDTDPGRVPDVVSAVVPLTDAVAAVGDLRAGRAMKVLLEPEPES